MANHDQNKKVISFKRQMYHQDNLAKKYSDVVSIGPLTNPCSELVEEEIALTSEAKKAYQDP